MDLHRDHVFAWMNELWNKWRGQLYAKNVKGKTISEALKNIPNGRDKKEWEWLVKEHFPSEKYQARSKRNTTNQANLKMPHHIGSKPIRETIYEKGGKDGNPPDLATIFYELHKKDGRLVEQEAIEKHAEIKEVVQLKQSLPSIEIVEKCFGPQTCSHVVGFGGGVKAKELEGGISSRAQLLAELRSAREENKFMKERMSTMEEDIKEMKELKEWMLAQQNSSFQPSTSPVSHE